MGVSLLTALTLSLDGQTSPPVPRAAQAQREKSLPQVPARRREQAEAAYMAGTKSLLASNFTDAERRFAEAVSLNPANADYTAALLVAREHGVTALLQQAALQRPVAPAQADRLINQARVLDSSNPRVLQHGSAATPNASPATSMRVERAASVVQLKPAAGLHSYHERGDTRSLATRIAGDYGLRVAFDPDLQTKSIRIDVDDVDADEALRILSLLCGTMAVPLDEHTLLLAANTTENRQRYERMVQETFYLPGYPTDQLNNFVSIAQQLLDIRQVSVAPLGGALSVRGPAERVAAIEQVLTDLLQGTSELVLDVKLYEVTKSKVRNLGIVLPNSLSAYSLAAQTQSIVAQNSALISQLVSSGVLPANATPLEIATYLIFVAGLGGGSLVQNSFLLLGGGLTTTALSAGNIPTLNLALTQSEARSLDDLQLRVSDQQRAIFRSGTRYPIQTSLFSDIASSTATSLAGTTVNGVSLSSLLASYLGTSSTGSSAVIPQVQYEDLGLTVTATPRIQRTGDVSLKLEVKVSALAGSALNGIPVLDSRQFASDITVHDGDTVLLISDTNHNESTAITGTPGLTDLPGFQSTTNRNGTQTDSDLVLLITPHIVRLGHTMAAGPYIPVSPRPGDE